MTAARSAQLYAVAWSRDEIREVERHRGKVNRGSPPPDWTGTALTCWLVYHLLVALAIGVTG